MLSSTAHLVVVWDAMSKWALQDLYNNHSNGFPPLNNHNNHKILFMNIYDHMTHHIIGTSNSSIIMPHFGDRDTGWITEASVSNTPMTIQSCPEVSTILPKKRIIYHHLSSSITINHHHHHHLSIYHLSSSSIYHLSSSIIINHPN